MPVRHLKRAHGCLTDEPCFYSNPASLIENVLSLTALHRLDDTGWRVVGPTCRLVGVLK
jgi:hypothetical protein